MNKTKKSFLKKNKTTRIKIVKMPIVSMKKSRSHRFLLSSILTALTRMKRISSRRKKLSVIERSAREEKGVAGDVLRGRRMMFLDRSYQRNLMRTKMRCAKRRFKRRQWHELWTMTNGLRLRHRRRSSVSARLIDRVVKNISHRRAS